ncbi:MAG: polysaccharide biosynthesis/export family protein [Bacteroidia bacterium]
MRKPHLAFFVVSMLLMGCRAHTLFQTPYDKDLRKAQKKHPQGIAAHESFTMENWTYTLQEGDFIICYAELPMSWEADPQKGRTSWVDTLRIDAEGKTYLPHIGFLNLAGKTLPQVEKEILAHYEKTYRDIRIRLEVRYVVYVFGEVPKQGIYYLPAQRIRLLDFLALVGGGNPESKWRSVKIIRPYKDTTNVYLLDLRKMQNLQELFWIYARDIVYVEPLNITLAVRAIQRYTVILGILQILNLLLILSVRYRF